MGAEAWTMTLTGPNLQEAFDRASAQDACENGTSGYSGTISQAGGVAQATTQLCHPGEANLLANLLHDRPYDPPTHEKDGPARESAHDQAARIFKRLGRTAGPVTSQWGVRSGPADELPVAEKWEGAYAIPVGAESDFKVTQQGVPLDLFALGLTHPYPHEAQIQAKIFDVLASRLGRTPRIAGIEVLDDNPRYVSTVKATEGAVVTKYHVYSQNGFGAVHRASKLEHDSIAKARAELTDLVKKPAEHPGPVHGGNAGTLEYVILGQKVREGGQALVVGRRELVSRMVIYQVTLVTPTAAAAKARPNAWMVYGMAAT